MTTQSTPGAAGFSSKSDPKGPVAGYDPLMKFRGKKEELTLEKFHLIIKSGSNL